MVAVHARFPGVVLRTPDQVVHLHAPHVPDLETFEMESMVLDSLTS